jgi:hypothetical protein
MTAIADLDDAFAEASIKGWDGYGALPASAEAREHGRAFLRALPEDIPPPQISFDPDGHVSCEWWTASRWAFVVSIGTNGEMWYAGLFGNARARGLERLTSSLPVPMLLLLRRALKGSD